MIKYEMKVVEDFETGGVGLFITKLDGDKRYIAEPVDLQFYELPRGHASKGPTLLVPHYESKGFFQAMQEALNDGGIEAVSESMAKGKLEAMSDHLEDMRVLMKLKKRG